MRNIQRTRATIKPVMNILKTRKTREIIVKGKSIFRSKNMLKFSGDTFSRIGGSVGDP
jgi:hypothetical protein